MDVFISLLALIFNLPLMLIAVLLIMADSPGPVFYRQQRLGLNGAPFTMLKLRTMRIDAEVIGPQWATVLDPRVTRVGRWLRLTRVDELPQFLNVILGTMSVIGPRPERPHFVEHLTSIIPHYHARASIKPGITGWAQVSYPYGASIKDAQQSSGLTSITSSIVTCCLIFAFC